MVEKKDARKEMGDIVCANCADEVVAVDVCARCGCCVNCVPNSSLNAHYVCEDCQKEYGGEG